MVGLLARKGAAVTGRDMDDVVLIPWTTAKFRLVGSRQSAGAQPILASRRNPHWSELAEPALSRTAGAALPSQVDDAGRRFPDAHPIHRCGRRVRHRRVGAGTGEREATDHGAFRERHGTPPGTPDDFRMRDWTEIADTLAASNRLIGNLLLCVALISLVVGGVGIMNIMLVAVSERNARDRHPHGRWRNGR